MRRPDVSPFRSATTGAMFLPIEAGGWHTTEEALALARAILELFEEEPP